MLGAKIVEVTRKTVLAIDIVTFLFFCSYLLMALTQPPAGTLYDSVTGKRYLVAGPAIVGYTRLTDGGFKSYTIRTNLVGWIGVGGVEGRPYDDGIIAYRQ